MTDLAPQTTHRRPTCETGLVRGARWLLLTVACLGGLAVPARAQMPKEDVVEVPAIAEGLCVSNLFQSNMVLQRDRPIVVWGWGEPGEEITVAFGGVQQTVEASNDRSWRASLAAMPANTSPRRMTVRGASDALTLDNILVGDVWVLGGQSNMEFELAKVENGALEIASANFPGIRILTVPYGEGPAARESFARLHEWSDWFGRHFRKGDWDVCTPEIARELSAIGYVFARRVHLASGVPIGVIDASRGGTTVETWIPQDVLREMQSPEVRAKLEEWDGKVAAWNPQADLEQRIERHRKRLEQLASEGKPVPEDQRAAPTDLEPGPIADPNHPGSCFAAMLAPLAGLPIQGVLFHQGYNNALDGMRGVRLYRELFPVMIGSWREAFADAQLPFGILSLCTDGYPQTPDNVLETMLNAGIHIRAAQYETFRALYEGGDETIGFASTYDLRRRWYHPQVKVPAGERIARWALSTQYGFGRELPWKPPLLLGREVQGGALLLRLDADVADPEDGAIVGFVIAGADRKFQPADVAYAQVGEDDRGRPRFDRKQLLLTSPLVAEPLHFRYAWGRNPLGNLQVVGNKDLPFATQRSDDWDMGTVPLGVLDGEIEGKLTRAQRGQVLKALRDEDERRRLAEARALLEEAGMTVVSATRAPAPSEPEQSAAANAAPLLRFGVIADCQYCAVERAGIRYYSKSVEKLRTCVEQLNELDLDFVVHLGDFIDRDWESFDAVAPIYDTLKAPHYHVLGNHDFSVADDLKARVPERLGLPSRWYDFTVGDFRFVVIDGNDVSFHAYPEGSAAWRRAADYYAASGTDSPKWNGALGAEQMEWLDRTLADATAQGQRAFVLCHFPVYPEDVHNLWNAPEVGRLLEGHDSFVGYLNGHNHAGNLGERSGRPYHTFHGMVDTETSAYSVVTLFGDRMEIDGFGRQPDRVLELRPAPAGN